MISDPWKVSPAAGCHTERLTVWLEVWLSEALLGCLSSTWKWDEIPGFPWKAEPRRLECTQLTSINSYRWALPSFHMLILNQRMISWVLPRAALSKGDFWVLPSCQSVSEHGVPGGMVVRVVPAKGHSTVSLACFSSFKFRKGDCAWIPALLCTVVQSCLTDMVPAPWLQDVQPPGLGEMTVWPYKQPCPRYSVMSAGIDQDRVFPKMETPASKVDWLDQTCSWNANLGFSGGTMCVCVCVRYCVCLYEICLNMP